MKRTITLCACLLAVSAGANAGDLAQAVPPPPLYPGVVQPPPRVLLPPYEIVAIVRSVGLRPIHRPMLHGAAYWVRAVGPTGERVRVVIDPRLGRVVRIDPVVMPRYAVRVVPAPYGRPPGLAPMPGAPYSQEGQRPPLAQPAPGFAVPSDVSRAPAVAAAPPSLQARPAPLPRARPPVAAAETPAKPMAGASQPPAPTQPEQAAPSPPSDTQPSATKPIESTGSISAPSSQAEPHE